MTTVHFKIDKPTREGIDAPAPGMLRLRPTRRRVKPGENVAALVLPDPFTVDVPASGTFDIDLDPCGPDWAWEVFGHGFASGPWTEYLHVPNRPEIDYADPELLRVDPKTLAPTAAPSAAWWAALNEAKLGAYATRDPDDDGVLVMHYQAWQAAPTDDLILIMPIQEA